MKALRQAVRDGLPRLLTLIDRAPFSPSRGSADRPFWHYRTDKDYPSATFAAAALPLALLARRPGLLGDGANQPLARRLAELAIDAIGWWAGLVRGDGSVDEWYLRERSQVASAFTTLAVAEAAMALGERFARAPGRPRVLAALERSSRWLQRHPDRDVANHSAGAVAALAAVARLTGQPPGSAGEDELRALLARQRPEGWFPEYGGADPGYGTVALALLARARAHGASQLLDQPIARLEQFLLPFINPDGSFGGEHGRRATRYAWLAGFALRAGASPAAAAALARLLAGLEAGSLPAPGGFDDRYFAFFAYPDAVLALDAIEEMPAPAAPAPVPAAVAGPGGAPHPPADVSFPDAGLHVRRAGGIHAVIGARVGGALKLYAAAPPGRLLFDDCGYGGRLDSGELVSSWSFPAEPLAEEDALGCRAEFRYWTRASPVARHPVLFRLFTTTLGRWAPLSAAAARSAKRRFTSRPPAAPLTLERRLRLEPGRATVDDRLTLGRGARPAVLCRVAAFAPIHVPSAPLWLPSFEPLLPAAGPDLAPRLVARGRLAVRTTVELATGRARLRVECDGEPLADDAVMIGD